MVLFLFLTHLGLGIIFTVVLVSVVVLTTYVFFLDYGFSKAILKIFGSG